jgi:ABC-type lipoprotein release transport system permease subunit
MKNNDKSMTRFQLLLMLAFRNLFRQKRRNILLGLAISIGMMLLVVFNSFTLGIMDNIMNRMMVYAMGHIQVQVNEKGRRQNNIIRDKEYVEKVMRDQIGKDLRFINQSVGTFTRLIGNGKAEMVIIVGLEQRNDSAGKGSWNFVAGDPADFTNGKVENPIMLYEDKAKDLKVKVGDYVKARIYTITGQEESARFQVVALLQSGGMFQSMATFAPLENMKKLLGMRDYETGSLQAIIRNPDLSVYYANKIHQALKPRPIAFPATVRDNTVEVYAFQQRSNALALLQDAITMDQGSFHSATNEDTVLISRSVANNNGLGVNSTLTMKYKKRFEDGTVEKRFKIVGVFDPETAFGQDVVLLSANTAYKFYYQDMPEAPPKTGGFTAAQTNSPVFAALAGEWLLQRRSKDVKDMEVKAKELSRMKWKGAAMDVQTMAETASWAVAMKVALFQITFIVIAVLFVVILIGVVNTLRMTVRERTREIGTSRAIGMQAKDIRNVFLLETGLLAFFASVAGIIAGFILMFLFWLPKIKTTSVLGMFLVENRLYFTPSPAAILFFLLVIVGISVATAWGPASQAAKMSAANALRHYD